MCLNVVFRCDNKPQSHELRCTLCIKESVLMNCDSHFLLLVPLTAYFCVCSCVHALLLRFIHSLVFCPVCCVQCGGGLIQRSDDTEAVVRDRLAVYHRETKPLIEFYTKEKLLLHFNVKRGLDDTPDLIRLLTQRS
jgi:adenylate kinase family enzyme